MKEFQTIKIEVEGALCTLTIDRPKALNALSTLVLDELQQAFDELSTRDDLRVVIITGAGRSFVAGADIAEIVNFSPAQAKAFGRKGTKVFRTIEMLPIPVIAAVNGFALGGGCELLLSCDIRIASSNAKFGQPEVGLGIPPGFGGTQRLPQVIGEARAKELIYTGRIIDAEEAYRIGLLNRVVEPDALLPTARALAAEIASRSPYAVRLSKEAICRGVQTDINTGSTIENNLFGLAFAGEEQREGMTAFLEKRTPNF